MGDFNFCGVFEGNRKWRKSVNPPGIIVLICYIVLVAGMVSCATTGEVTIDMEAGPPQRSGGSTDPSWAFAYNGIEDMCAHSDIIVVGTADSISEIDEEQRPYTTYWNFRIELVLKGDNTKEITVGQMGSPDVPGSEISSCPLFHFGDRYLLFLNKSEVGSYYFHPQGHFMVWEDKVYSMNYILPENDALRPVPGLNPNRAELETVEEQITGIVDSVHFMFTRYSWRGPGDVIRYDAGMTREIYANLFTGDNGPGKVTLKIDKELLLEGIDLRINPAEFTVKPYGEYESRILITTAYNIAPGTYLIPVEYDFEGVGSGSRTVTLHINDPADFPEVTNEDLLKQGLPPLGGSEEE
ncbi:hypothetical protein ACFLXY_00465 [Chloroflexota bacterium]